MCRGESADLASVAIQTEVQVVLYNHSGLLPVIKMTHPTWCTCFMDLTLIPSLVSSRMTSSSTLSTNESPSSPSSIPSGGRQVWSLTQFYSVDFSPSRISVNKCGFNRRRIKVCVRWYWQSPETSVLSVAHLRVY